jgi:hypothetical protein
MHSACDLFMYVQAQRQAAKTSLGENACRKKRVKAISLLHWYPNVMGFATAKSVMRLLLTAEVRFQSQDSPVDRYWGRFNMSTSSLLCQNVHT